MYVYTISGHVQKMNMMAQVVAIHVHNMNDLF